MPTFSPLLIKERRLGLNLVKRDDDLYPGELITADNVDLSGESWRKRPGHRPVFTGSLDSVLRGGPSSLSMEVRGEEWWLEHRPNWHEALGDTNPSTNGHVANRRDFFHHRQGVLLIPEDDLSTMRLDVQPGDPDWAIEFCLSTDSLPLFRTIDAAAFGGVHFPFNVVVAAKSTSTTSQWALRLIPDATSTDRFHIVLTLYEGSVHTAGTDFYYQSGAARGWAEPGKRLWVAFKYTDGGSPTITSYYWIQGQTSVLSSTQAVSGTLRTNGVVGSTYPICIGRRPLQWNRDTATVNREMGFTGVVSELRFWAEAVRGGGTTLDLPANFGTVTASPPAASDWYVEKEIPDDQLTLDAAVESGNLAQTYDLKAYWQFKPELLGTGPDGVQNSGENHRFIRPRFRETGTGPAAWLTGADATWVAGSGALGSYALSFIPPGPSGQKNTLLEAVKSGTPRHAGYRMFGAGIRIPNGNVYLRRNSSGSGSTTYEWPDALSALVFVRCDALPPTGNSTIILEFGVARRGVAAGPVTVADYGVEPAIRLAIVESGGVWKFLLQVVDGAGTYTSIYSTTTVVEGTTYAVLGSVRWEDASGSIDRDMAIFVDGVREATNTAAASSKPFLSQTTASDSTAPNENDEDGRDACYPISLGCACRTQASADWAAPPNPYSFRFGSVETALTQSSNGFRYYWGFHTNETPKSPNDGVMLRGENALCGVVGGLHIWQKYVNESEARSFATRGPNSAERAADGELLKSSWDMNEGQGTTVFDNGYVGNHLLINPLPTVRAHAGDLQRLQRPAVLGMWQRQLNQTNANVPVRETYVLSSGAVHRLDNDGSGNPYLSLMGPAQTPELYEPWNKALTPATSFVFGGQTYVCTGLGAVRRIVNGKVLDAGITPVFGDIGQDQTHLGWREFDRDGTFDLLGNEAPGSIFAENGKWGYAITYYDPESGLESAPSRVMYITANNVSAPGIGLAAVTIYLPPHPPQRNITKYRIYRTQKDGTVLKLLDEVDITRRYVDTTTDTKLGTVIDQIEDPRLNFPPPQNARLGVIFGRRAVYAGIKDRPNTIVYSLLGQPGACPAPYTEDLPDEVTALLVFDDRLLVGTRSGWFAFFDAGTDIGFEAVDQPPMQYIPLKTGFGCLGHHGCSFVPNLGWIVPSERGLYLTNGSQFQYISKRIEPFWRTLQFNYAKNFVAVNHQRRGQILLFCSTTSSPDARNDTCLVWDYERGMPADQHGAFGFTLYRNLPGVVSASIVDDDDTGIDRTWLGDHLGNIWDFDPAETALTSDGVTASPYSGATQEAKKDPTGTGKYTRIKLVTGGTLPTAGTGLRGAHLFITNAGTQWHTTPLKVVWNDTNWVWVEATAANTTDPTGFEWRLGAIGFDLKTGKMDLGIKSTDKKVEKGQISYGLAGGTTLLGTIGYDELAAQATTLNPSLRYNTFLPPTGRGRRVQMRLYDTALYGGQPNSAIEVLDLELDYQMKSPPSTAGA